MTIRRALSEYAIFIALGIEFLVLAIFAPSFFTADNFSNVLRQNAFPAIIAAGMTFAILTGGIDLSVGSVVGLSGGIDSALTCCLAVEALGHENVRGISMPSPYSSRGSVEDSRALARNLAVEFKVIPITSIHASYLETLAEHFVGRDPDVTEENLQARIRGNILMAISNQHGHLVLSTGNKSETSVGFATLYGDTAGGFAPLKDVYKTQVYGLARWRNEQAGGPWIPESTLTRAPTPELKAHQLDQDVLPPYDVLDAILAHYVEEEMGIDEIGAQGLDRATVAWVAAQVDRAEYKRRQSPPGVKITERAFGRDRRMPITKKGR